MQTVLTYPYGEPETRAVLKSSAADFEVEEVLGFEPVGEGEHLFLWVEKSGLGTMELITRMAKDHGLPERDFGYSGQKDKHALTRQWLSLHLPGKEAPFELPSGEGYRVLRQLRHHKKLRPGTHKFNRFSLCLREVHELSEKTQQQLDRVQKQGFANYFGHQRFGRKQDNVEQALAQLGTRKLSRTRKSMLLSSLRSYLFNRILNSRIELGHWETPLAGDVFMLRGSHSIFADELDGALLERHRQQDVSACASLYGSGRSLMSGDAAQIEQRVFAENAEITDCLQRNDSRLQMRPLRVAAEAFSYDYDSAAALLRLELSLPTGCYVTTMLAHFLVLDDASQARKSIVAH
jgi:tRNA pseudouridine13 synthase